MKVQTKTVLALALASSASAFAPSSASQSRPMVEVSMAQQTGDNDVVANLGKTAMSFVTASALAFSTVTTIFPVDPVEAAKAPEAPVQVDKKTVKKLSAEKAKAAAEKEAIAKMGKEAKERHSAKKSLALSQASLKEYTKFVSESKGAESKATNALKAEEKATANAEASFKAASEKLNAAKKQKMPSSAIKELSEIQGTSCSSYVNGLHNATDCSSDHLIMPCYF
jgi:hypothetical protein